MTEYLLIYVTASSPEEAETIASVLVGRRLAACANIVPAISSVFWWNAAIDHAQETLIMFKSTRALFPAIVEAVKSLHSYEVPEIIATPIVCGSEDYLSWISAETQTLPA